MRQNIGGMKMLDDDLDADKWLLDGDVVTAADLRQDILGDPPEHPGGGRTAGLSRKVKNVIWGERKCLT